MQTTISTTFREMYIIHNANDQKHQTEYHSEIWLCGQYNTSIFKMVDTMDNAFKFQMQCSKLIENVRMRGVVCVCVFNMWEKSMRKLMCPILLALFIED